mmetsp:Transcript_25070/g.56854  ORF Transcript_25070/g.56854 Transcript_25070/m.56854 type:complete len:322 (-) Transcript_25070:60-1025(-)
MSWFGLDWLLGYGEEEQAEQELKGGRSSLATAENGQRRSAPRSEILTSISRPDVVAGLSGDSNPDADRVYRERVFVRVYDLGQTFFTRSLNRVTKSYGAFHTGVEVYGREWSFGMTFNDWSTGITWNLPGKNPDHSFRETLAMGYTSLSPKQVMRVIDDMKREWRGCTYNVLSRNCHTFSDAFCGELGVARVPRWVNDLAGAGAATAEYISCIYPELDDMGGPEAEEGVYSYVHKGGAAGGGAGDAGAGPFAAAAPTGSGKGVRRGSSAKDPGLRTSGKGKGGGIEKWLRASEQAAPSAQVDEYDFQSSVKPDMASDAVRN